MDANQDQREETSGTGEGAGLGQPPADARWPVRIRGLRKSFGAHEVLRGVDLDIERAKINVIIGASGQGKTLLVKHIIALVKPDAGQVWIDGEDVVPMDETELGRVRRKLGMLFQQGALFDSMTVAENVAFPLRERHPRMPRAAIDERIDELLERLGIAGTRPRFPGALSGGERKRAALARALADHPQIVLYDEPTTGLDPMATDNVDQMIRDAARAFGVTSVVISHDMASVFRIADRVAMLHDGRIRLTGAAAEVLASPDPVLRRFLAPAALPLAPGLAPAP